MQPPPVYNKNLYLMDTLGPANSKYNFKYSPFRGWNPLAALYLLYVQSRSYSYKPLP